jgi:hypothetical protein
MPRSGCRGHLGFEPIKSVPVDGFGPIDLRKVWTVAADSDIRASLSHRGEPRPTLTKQIVPHPHGPEMSSLARNFELVTIERLSRHPHIVHDGGWCDPVFATQVVGHHCRPISVPLFRPVMLDDGRSARQFWVGLESVVRGALKSVGAIVTSRVPIPTPLLDPASLSVRRFCEPDFELMHFINRNLVGLVRVNLERIDLIELLVQIARRFANRRIAIIVPSDAAGWAERLGRQVDTAYADSRYHFPRQSRIAVATSDSLGMLHFQEREIVVVIDPLNRLGIDPLAERENSPFPRGRGRTATLIERLVDVRGRLFGIIDRHYRPSPYEVARLTQMFGSAEIVIPSHGAVLRKVQTAWLEVRGGPEAKESYSPLEHKRRFIWSNPVLVRRVSRLARAIQDGNYVVVGEMLPGAVRTIHDLPTRRVAIFVENKIHAEQFARKLAGWQIVSACLQDGFDTPEAPFIVTASGLDRVDQDKLDVLIRADGGPGPLPAPADWLATRSTPSEPLLLVDLEMSMPPLLRRWTRSRREAYVLEGWVGLNEDSDIVAYKRFCLRTARGRRRI